MEKTAQAGEAFLDIKDLVVEYHTDDAVIHAVNGVNLKLAKGETLGLVGETGAGKTSIARSILRILPDPPAKIMKGEIWFNGENILKLPEKKVRSIRGDKISMIFQDPMTALNPIETVGSQISEAIRLHNSISRADANKQAVQMLETVGIPGKRFTNYPLEFSGGMKQRVVIAMALACKPELLLADEPTTALDVTIQAQVLEMMRDLQKDFGASVILITHDLGIVAEMCEKVAIIYAGEVVEYGTAEDIFDHRAHPYTEGLFGSIPTIHTKTKRLNPIRGMMPDPANLPSCCRFAGRCPYTTDECTSSYPEMVECKSQPHTVRCVRARVKEGGSQ
ncbi:MAG: ABC transporter ATP-binding protein [Peptococcaceae bacterium]|jgi:peptide/nickel transport system ATP-binding protein|nr:ABC transporter ATP-binding protein [Peptococcaceae bacterium]